MASGPRGREFESHHSDHVGASFVSLAPIFLQKSERAHVAAPPSPAKPAAMRGPPIYAACRLRHTFLQKLPARSFRCVSSFAKSHARLACSVVNALTTAHCRYQLFANYEGLTPTSEKPKKSFSYGLDIAGAKFALLQLNISKNKLSALVLS